MKEKDQPLDGVAGCAFAVRALFFFIPTAEGEELLWFSSGMYAR